MKRCPRCKEMKEDGEFHRNPNTGKLAAYCRPCFNAYHRDDRLKNPGAHKRKAKKWRQANPEKVRASVERWKLTNPEGWRKARRKANATWASKNRDALAARETVRRGKIRQDVFMAYGGFVCVCCGEKGPMFLTIDHINNDGANHRRELKAKIGNGGAAFFYWLKQNKFPKGFQVLCRNCNWGKHANGGVCPHITDSEGSTTRAAARSAKRHEARSTVQLASGDDIVSSAWRHAAARNGRVVQ